MDKFEFGYQAAEKIKIQCPGCGVVYEVDYIHRFPVNCLNCNAEYMQPIHDISNPEYIRQAAYRCRG
jgi:DNA-directed RNA polymerase subunit RPC12/RpoP